MAKTIVFTKEPVTGKVKFENTGFLCYFEPGINIMPHPEDENRIRIGESFNTFASVGFTFRWDEVLTPVAESRDDLIDILAQNFFYISSLTASGGATAANQTNGNQKSQIVDLDGHIANVQKIDKAFEGDEYMLSTNSIIHALTKDSQGNSKWIDIKASRIGSLNVKLMEYQGDAFGRLRVSEPYTLFDSSANCQTSDTLFWNYKNAGAGASSYDANNACVNMTVAALNDYIIRQTKQRFKYQPGKSHMVLITGLFNTEANIEKGCGLLDFDNIGLPSVTVTPRNGIAFINNNGTPEFAIFKNGVKTESKTQASWNIDKADGTGVSEFILNLASTNIVFIDLEWLGVGAVRCGFVNATGEIIVCHQFRHASNGFSDVYMRTANLPVSYFISSAGGAGSMKAICSSVISEGGFNPQGVTRVARNTSAVSVLSGASTSLVGIRLKSTGFEFPIDPTFISILSTANGSSLWALAINPTYTGTPVWNDLPNSEAQISVSNLPITAEGIIIAAGSFSNDLNSLNEEIKTSLRIGKNLSGVLDELWLYVSSIGNDSYYGAINFRQFI